MADRIYPGADERSLEGGWTLLLTESGRYSHPSEIDGHAARLSAPVPGTVAQALTAEGLFDPAAPQPLHGKDAWYFRSLAGEVPGPAVLRFEGLATIAEVFVNGSHAFTSESMFEAHDLPVEITGNDGLAICFRALQPHLDKRGPRARWRPQMIDHQGLRLVRTTLLGHMPGWCPSIHPVGPWRPVRLIRPADITLSDLRITADLDEDASGILEVSCASGELSADARIACGGHEAPLCPGADGIWRGRLDIPNIAAWWPRTHGKPALHEAEILSGPHRLSIGPVGFRRITVEHGSDGKDFALRVNGERIFCRGAVWTSADVVSLPGTAESYAPWLAKAAEANMNMIRIGGTMAYETADFFRLCDRLGLMVWQDFMFANYDYPVGDPAFVAHVEREARQFLASVQGSPSLAVLCGGSEIHQQAAMMGLPAGTWQGLLTEVILPRVCSALRPDVPYVANSPCGGAMPFSPNVGVTHYYGVGAYCRPLEDARRANVRFAAECLAFAHVPQQETLDRELPVAPVHDPRWKARVPRDRGASWDFEDIRDHYLHELYGQDPARLRRENPASYLALSRAVTAEIVTETFAEWRRPGSSCNGAVVWTFQDLLPGPGWGVIDSTGEPKPVWYALKRAFRPVGVAFADEGTNGLDVHVLNEAPQPLTALLSVTCLRDGRQQVVAGERLLTLPARGALLIPCTDLFGAFFDTTYAFRFGPPSHDVTIARLADADSGTILAEAFHFPLGRAAAWHDAQISAALVEEDGDWLLELRTDRLAQSVHVAVEGYRVDDDWFHLAPGHAKQIRLSPRAGTTRDQKPTGSISRLGTSAAQHF